MPVKQIKRVRFAHHNIYYPTTPDLTAVHFSSSTSTSSEHMTRPPSRAATPRLTLSSISKSTSSSSQTHGLPLPSTSKAPLSSSRYSGRVLPHRYLENSAISWDIIDHPSTLARHHRSVLTQALHEPATKPLTDFVSLTTPYLPWTIKVIPSEGSFVTVGDVVDSIYRSLQMKIAPSDLNVFPSPDDKRRVMYAFQQRYRRHHSSKLYEEEKRGGMKRVDFLMGHTGFFGISNLGRRSDNWQLNVK